MGNQPSAHLACGIPALRFVRTPRGLGVEVPQELLTTEEKYDADRIVVRFAGTREATFRLDEVWDPVGITSTEQGKLEQLRAILHEEVRYAAHIVEAKDLQRRNGGHAGALYLRDHIPAHRWGITREAWDGFMDEVRAKYDDGEIQNIGRPYDDDKFQDRRIGPNMYQINDQLIKQMSNDGSLMCPGVSWALMGSLAGTPVTFFVSHAWAEGVFEFDRYLRSVWAGDGAAYICFLSNPQNLPVGQMLETIPTSPFYVALKNLPSPEPQGLGQLLLEVPPPLTGKMILVATENAIVHERKWCVLELYLAMKDEIDIVVTGRAHNLVQDQNRASFATASLQQAQHEYEHPRWVHARGVHFQACEIFCSRTCDALCEDKCPKVRYWSANASLSCCCLAICLVIVWMICGFSGVYFSVPMLLGLAGVIAFACVFLFVCPPQSVFSELDQAAQANPLIDVSTARCHDNDMRMIDDYIRGKEEKINRMVGRLFLRSAEAATRDPYLRGDRIGHSV